MKQYLLLFSLIFSLVGSFAQTSNKSGLTVKPSATSNFSAERLLRVDALLQQYVDKGWIAGATALIAKDGRIIYHKAIGHDDISTKKPLAKEAIFRIASQTKAITSVGIMMLWEEGRLMLDEPVSKYIPEFRNPKVLANFNADDTTFTTVPARSEITIRQLLNHTSGIGYAQIGSKQMNAIYYKAGVVGGIGVDNLTLGDKMKVLGGLPLFHQPGEKFTYGLNTDVLGYVIEVVSGMSLDRFFQQRIFGPFGMKDTYFYLPAAKKSRLVTLYTEDDQQKLVKAPEQMFVNGNFYPDFPARAGTYFSGGGGLSSTALDYFMFMQMLLNGGTYNGVRLLSPATVRMMTTNQIGDIQLNANGQKFGLGFEIVTEQSKGRTPLSVGSFSWGGMFSSTYWIDPKEKIVAQLFLNQYPNSHGEVHEKFKAMVYAALE
jgi:CubicO group peptidase (beta-lactamase class C family)